MKSSEFVDIAWENEVISTTPLNLECTYRNLATHVCLNSNCSSFVFLCIDKTCECYKQHKGCIKGSIQSINEAIQEKRKSIEPFQERIDQLIENAINQLSRYRQRIIVEAEQNLNFIGLTQNQRKFLKALKTKKVDQLTGKQMNEIFSSINNVTGFNEKMKKNQTWIQQAWNSFNISMKNTFHKVQSFLETFIGNIGFQLNQSLIIKTQDHRKNLLGFFDKKIQMMSLLYRASQNNFDTSKFFQNCKNVKNTLVICQTEYGKIIGGFCASNWKIQYDDYRWVDESRESFLFSLTNCDKFLLQQSGNAFRYRSGFGPMFGNSNGTDFFISNRANKQRQSGANINNGYYNNKYTRDSKESWENFSGGNQDFRFLVKEWQVWHIKFDQNKNK